ncbi:hypothetical protein ACIPM0_15890 [Pseudomonas sichuanensis]|uniref:hypothetical protein n=1 Tax=Pseudomonas sichuanensis TaxID=2213015 RepID=UPI0038032A24
MAKGLESMIIGVDENFPLDDLQSVARMLEDANILLPGYIPPDCGIYEPATYFYEQALGYEFVILPDRNVASRIAQLAQRRVALGDGQLTTTAALLAFAQCLNIQFEPGAAFHELAHLQGNQIAREELSWFRSADVAIPQDILNVALGRSSRVARTYQPTPEESLDLAKPIKRWNRNYILALKILELEGESGSAVDKMLRLLDWMATGFIFGGPASLLAALFLATHSAPKKKVFKSRNSINRASALAGVRNAAWDVTHLSLFVERMNQCADGQNKRYIFASFDTHLRMTTELMLAVTTAHTEVSALATNLSNWWGDRDALRIAESLIAHLTRINREGFEPKVPSDRGNDILRELITDGERKVLAQF